MNEAERDLLFYMARMLASRADPAGKVAPEIERLLARAIEAAAKEKPGAA
jgi:hypothetical protein